MDNTGTVPVVLEQISSKRVAAVALFDLFLLAVVVGVSTQYSPHAEHLDLIGQERIESERNSTLDMELQIRGMTPSHRHMDINAQFLQSDGSKGFRRLENDSWHCACIARFRSALDCDWNIFVSRATSPRQAGKAAAASRAAPAKVQGQLQVQHEASEPCEYSTDE